MPDPFFYLNDVINRIIQLIMLLIFGALNAKCVFCGE